MSSVCLVSCVKTKKETKDIAENLYTSPFFTKAKLYAKSFDKWFILSALYGLVQPFEVISPYELTLNNYSRKQRIQWSLAVYKKLINHLDNASSVVFLAGMNYREFLEPQVRKDGFNVIVPMRGLGIGKQLRWLDVHNN